LSSTAHQRPSSSILKLAAFSLGASPSLLHQIYDRESVRLVPLSPEERRKQGAKVKEIPEINEENWKDFLGVPE